jgi:mono/diheme cytochrome c family protein
MNAGCLFVLPARTAATASARDASRGALLYDTHCIACHREGLHDRKNSKVSTYADLRFQVERWTAQLGRRFTEADREDLIEYLDATHYRLGQRPPKR